MSDMASIEEDKMLAELSEDIDKQFLVWLTEHKIPALNLTAIILARLTWLAKQTDTKDDFLELLKAPAQILKSEEEKYTLQ